MERFGPKRHLRKPQLDELCIVYNRLRYITLFCFSCLANPVGIRRRQERRQTPLEEVIYTSSFVPEYQQNNGKQRKDYHEASEIK